MKKFFQEFWLYRVPGGLLCFVVYEVGCILWTIVLRNIIGGKLMLFSLAGGIVFSILLWAIFGHLGTMVLSKRIYGGMFKAFEIKSLPEIAACVVTGGILILIRALSPFKKFEIR